MVKHPLSRDGKPVARNSSPVLVEEGQAAECDCCGDQPCDCDGIDWENTSVELRSESYSYQASNQTINTAEADCTWKPAGTLQSGPNVSSEFYSFHSRTAEAVYFSREDEWGEHFIRWNCLLGQWEMDWGGGDWEAIYHILAVEPEVEVGYAPGHPDAGMAFACEAWHTTYPGYDKCEGEMKDLWKWSHTWDHNTNEQTNGSIERYAFGIVLHAAAP